MSTHNQKRQAGRGLRAGAAAIEFALCLPIVLAILGAVVDLSFYISTIEFVSRAAREGARVGSTVIEGATPTGDQIEAEAESQTAILLTEMGHACGANCTVQADWLQIDTEWYVRVRVDYPYEPIVGLAAYLPDYATAEFTMLTQQQP
jgi:Flp pilus assembly protein TadG